MSRFPPVPKSIAFVKTKDTHIYVSVNFQLVWKFNAILCSRKYRENAKFIWALLTMTARTKRTSLWGLAKVNMNFIQVHNFNKVEVAMLFYVVGNIVFWTLAYKEHNDRPYQSNIAFVISKSELCKKQSVQSRKRLRCYFM